MKVIIPQDLNEITLKQMIKLADIEKLEIDEVEKAKEVIKLLVDKVDDSNINRIKVLDLLAMYKKLCAMTNTETSATYYGSTPPLSARRKADELRVRLGNMKYLFTINIG